MQNLVYDQAVYDILYYDANLDAYRTDTFAGWRNQPSNGTPIFSYGTLQYTLLTDAKAVPTPGPTVLATAGASGAPATQPPSTGASDTGGSSTLLILLLVVVLVVVGAWWYMRRRRAPAVEEE
jgi:LPXTG-motif cell wall-anchored protein